jgi:hypothetical protein
MQGTGHGEWGAVMGLTLRQWVVDPTGAETGCPYDASVYRGVTFWAIGSGEEVRVKATMMETTPLAEGGICAAADPNGCWDDHGNYVTLGASWKQYTVAFSVMTREGWGGLDVTFNAKHLYMLRFQTSPDVDFDYFIDDVAFVP